MPNTIYKKRGGTRLAMAGLVFGVLIGFSILGLKRYLALELVDLLADEVAASCECEFKVDTVSLSLITLRAKAQNAAIIADGHKALNFPIITASFSLRDIFKHVIHLDELKLINGYADGVGPESPTFKFIDHLSEPSSSGKAPLIKLKLHNLTVIDSAFSEPFSRSTLRGSGVGLKMIRNKRNNFVLSPFIKKLSLELTKHRQSQEPTAIYLGEVHSTFEIYDSLIDFSKIFLTRFKSRVDIIARSLTDQGNSLSGKVRFFLDQRALGAPEMIHSNIEGSASLGGTLGSPALKGKFSLPAKESAGIFAGTLKLFDLEKVNGSFKFDTNHGKPLGSIETLNGIGPLAALKLQQPLKLNDDELRGAVHIEIGSIKLPDGEISGISGMLKLGGKLDEPVWKWRSSVKTVRYTGMMLKNLLLQLSVKGAHLNFLLTDSLNKDKLSASGNVILTDSPTLQKLNFKTDALPLYLSFLPEQDLLFREPIFITGSGSGSGALNFSGLSLNARLKVASRHFKGEAALNSDLKLTSGILTLNLSNQSGSISSKITVTAKNRNRGTLSLILNEFKPKEYNPELQCVRISADLNYNFPLQAVLAGDGSIDLNNIEIGCKPYTVSLKNPTKLPIQSGRFTLNKIVLSGEQSHFVLDGSISQKSGYQIELAGKLKLATLLPLLPNVDDIRGNIKGHATINGSLDNPQLSGSFTVNNGELSIESANISSHDISGDIVLSQKFIKVKKLTGLLNGGRFQIAAEIFPLTFEKSFCDLKFSNMSLELLEETPVILSGSLSLTQNELGRTAIAGEIEIENAEFKRKFDLLTLVETIRDYLITNRSSQIKLNALPSLDLDVSLTAGRNIFILTNWLGAEFRADVHIGGTLDKPRISGTMNSLRGWLGLKGRRFEITSGEIRFSPATREPELNMLAETYVRSREGDNILVILEAHGPLTSPTIELSSDSPYSQKELLTLITTGGRDIRQTRAGSAERDFEPLLLDAEDSSESSLLGALFSRLTSIDTLSLEPNYNRRRGVIEPQIIAQKNLSNRLAIIAKSFISAANSESSLVLSYDLTDELNLAGMLQTVDNNQRDALALDLTYTILSSQKKLLEININGNKAISRGKLLTHLRLNNTSRIPESALDKIKRSIEDYYHNTGYMDAIALVKCELGGDYCKKLSITVKEGTIYTISKIIIRGENLPKFVNNIVDQPAKNTVATRQYLTKIQNLVLHKLRSEGFIGARVSAEYKKLRGSRAKLVLSVYSGAPVSFYFSGNTVFSANDFLNTINLFKRKQPFGANTINILIENIERLYREAGYLYATISYTRDVSTDNRINYRINIIEEERVPVSGVEFKGNKSLSSENLSKLIEERFPEFSDDILSPEFAVDEMLRHNSEAIKEVYVWQGFPAAMVKYRIVPNQDERSVKIIYHISEGDRLIASKIITENWPDKIQLPKKPDKPISVPKINSYIETLLEKLIRAGYLKAEITTQMKASNEPAVLLINPGKRTRISSIIIKGAQNIDVSVIKSRLLVQAGDPWDQELIDLSRKRLLRLGLFSRVQFEPSDGSLDQPTEQLTVTVIERSLHTLEIGGGVHSEFGTHLFGEFTDRGIFADGRGLAMRADLYYDPTVASVTEGIASLRYSDPFLFDSNYRLTEDLRYQKLELANQEFDLDRISLTSFVLRSFSDDFDLSLGHTLLEENLDNVSPDAVIGKFDTGTVKLSFVSASLNYDRRDSRLNPTRGFNLSLDALLATKKLGSDASYFGLEGKFSFIKPLPLFDRRISFAFNSRAGSLWTFNGTDNVPISQRYYLGGRTSVRGFRENSLGPRGVAGSVIGGDLLLQQNTELRYRLNDFTSLIGFFDAGTVFLKDRSISSGDLRESAGIGIRYLSPIGPIGFDIGHPLDERAGEPSFRFHFSIGSAF
ncbi:MAG: outer membrane protein assembly factor BamA [Candidatus Dadabacteria bacterium]|nr:MAG: outer membrane protein assembly factor BamA [Candidatus Dadabacteria bacterium]